MNLAVHGERRRATRRRPDPLEAVARVRLRTGRELSVVDIGSAGALVESEGRLLPGTCVDVHVVTIDGRELVRCRVVRALVWSVAPDRIVYRAALAFERPVDVGPGYPIPADAGAVHDRSGSEYPAGAARAVDAA